MEAIEIGVFLGADSESPPCIGLKCFPEKLLAENRFGLVTG